MKRLRPFDLAFPASVGEAAGLLAAGGGEARLLAGGTDLLVDMKLGRMCPRLLIGLRQLGGLEGVERVAGGIRIGAMTRVSAIAGSSLVTGGWRALVRAAGVLGSPPIRRLATIGGNLGRGSPASDLSPALLVHDALVLVAGTEGTREIPLADLHSGPGATTLDPGELIIGVFLPDPAPRSGSAHCKLGRRAGGWDLAVAGASASLACDEEGRVAAARVALSSVGPTVLRCREAEEALVGRFADAKTLGAAALAAAGAARPMDDVRATAAYRRRVVPVLVRRALEEAGAAARAGGDGQPC